MSQSQLAQLCSEHVNLHTHRISREVILSNMQWSDFRSKAIEHFDHIDSVARDMKVTDWFYTSISDVTLNLILCESLDHNSAERILAGCHQLIRHLQDIMECEL